MIMKNIFIGLLSLFFYFSSLSISGACEFLKEKIGTPVSNIIEKYDNLDEPPGGDDPTATYVKEYDSLSLCENSQLENSVLKVFIKEGKLIGTEIEGALGEAKNNKIIDFAKTHLGYTSEVDFDEEWTGAISLSSFGDDVIYGRASDSSGIYEMLIITKPEFDSFLFGPNVVKFF
jgi:hypothetical protein